MAKIEFSGFVEDVLEGRTGAYGLKIAEPHRKKNGDEWVTVARTFHRVTGAYEATINWSSFSKGDRVDVEGRQVTDPYTDNTGKKQYPLIVRASSIVPAERGGQQHAAPAADAWAAADDSSPF